MTLAEADFTVRAAIHMAKKQMWHLTFISINSMPDKKVYFTDDKSGARHIS